jgi:hypothetical protein
VKRTGLILLFLLLLPFAANAQQTSATAGGRHGGDPAKRAAEQAKRDSLELEIAKKFMTQLTRDLKLDATQRSHVERVLQESGVRKKELARATSELRGRMSRAANDKNTADPDFQKLLAEYEQLRVREHDVWRRDQEELARFLTPRQRVQFLAHWARFQESVKEIADQKVREQRAAERTKSQDRPR